MVKKAKPQEIEPHWYETPFEFLGWVDEQERFHPVNSGNQYLYSACGYGWRRVWGVTKP